MYACPAHAVINNGEPASDILGQFASVSSDTTPDYTKGCVNNGASPLGFYQSQETAIDLTNNWLFVADTLNSRVLVFPLNATTKQLSSKTPSYVLGQTNFTTCASAITQSSMNNPAGLAVDSSGQRLFVGDADNARVLVFSYSGGFSNGMNASYVLGQSRFTTAGRTLSQSGFSDVSGLAFDSANGLLYVADEAYNRVVAFNVAPGSIANGENASYVIGQSNFTTGGDSTTQAGLYGPQGLALDATNEWLYVADNSNNRVMVFPAYGNANWSSPGENASYELGQPSGATAFTTNATATTQSGMNSPTAITFDGANSRLFVGDNTNSRVLIFNTASLANGMNASYELGQPNFTTNGHNVDNANQSGFYFLWGYGYGYDPTNDYLYLGDAGDNRVMIFNVTPPAMPTPSAVTQSGQDACAVGGGQLYCWGYNNYGQDGLGNTTLYATPQQVGTDTAWTAVSQGDPSFDQAACGIDGGQLYCWGRNRYGELGLGNTTQYTSPQEVPLPSGVTSWTAVSASGSDTCAIANTGALYCWGRNNRGEDGLGNTTQYETPQQVGSATDWIAVSTGGTDTCGIQGSSGSGELYCWGYNHRGEVGNGGTTEQTSPVAVGTSISTTGWTVVSQGAYDTCGISGGALYCWGYNSQGELGLGNTTQYETPQQVGTATNWTVISIQHYTSDGDACGISGGALYCWGDNAYGELGLGNATQYETPQQVGSATTWTAVSYGDNDACGISGGALYCWGENSYGEDGVDSNSQNNSPVAVALETLNGENATDELGQYSSPSSTATVEWAQNSPNNGPTALGMFINNGGPGISGGNVTLDPVNHYLYVSDNNDNRVLVYALNVDNSFPTGSGGHTASYVLGQTSLQGANAENCSATGMSQPMGLAFDTVNSRLFVVDQFNGRVLVFDNMQTPSTGMNASYSIGQANLTSCTYADTPSQSQFSTPWGVAYDAVNQRLFVVDNGWTGSGEGNRVLVFNVAPGTIANGENASYVLGQTNFTNYNCNMGGSNPTQSSLCNPVGVAYDATNTRLFVSDSANSRVMVFNVPTSVTNGTSYGENASYVLGQSSYTYGSPTFYDGIGGLPSQSSLPGVQGLSYDPNSSRLFVGDEFERVMVFNVAPGSIANGENASFELGYTQANANSYCSGNVFTCQNGGTSQTLLGYELYPYYDPGSGRLFVGDSYNNRIMIFQADDGAANFMKMLPD